MQRHDAEDGDEVKAKNDIKVRAPDKLHALEMAERPRPRPLRHVPGIVVARLPWSEIKTRQVALRRGIALLQNWVPR